MPHRATDEQVLHASRGLMVVKRGDGTLSLRWRWFSARKLILGTSLSLAPLGLPWLQPEFRSLNLLSVLVAGCALWGLYWAATQLLNSTRLEVDRQTLSVRHGPVPWPGGIRLPVTDLEQLYVGWEVYRAPRSGRRSYTFTLRAKLKQGGDAVLVGGPIDLDRAKALEQVLELHLGIANVPVTAEWR